MDILGYTSLQENPGPSPYSGIVILIMGPTGSGKSSFVESFKHPAFQKKLQLSKNQLEGHTQTVTRYLVENVVQSGRPVYLVDTPGFADSKFSENEIIKMVREKGYGINHAFYFTPINETRLPATKRKTIQMLTTMLKHDKDSVRKPRVKPYEHLTIVTTFWDALYDDRTWKRGEDNHAELKDKHFKPFIDQGARIVKFENTRESALSILQRRVSTHPPRWQDDTWPLYRDLLERIQNRLQEKQNLESELESEQAQPNDDPELNIVLNQRLHENHTTLTRFLREFVSFKNPPAHYADVAAELRPKIPDSMMISAEYDHLFKQTSSALQSLKSLESQHSYWRNLRGKEFEETLLTFVSRLVNFQNPPAEYEDAAAQLLLTIPEHIMARVVTHKADSDSLRDSAKSEEGESDPLEDGPSGVAVDLESAAKLETLEPDNTPSRPIDTSINATDLPVEDVDPVDTVEPHVQSELQHTDNGSPSTLISPPISDLADPPPIAAPEHRDRILVAKFESVQHSRASSPVYVRPPEHVPREALKKLPRRFLESFKRLLDKWITSFKRPKTSG